MEIYIKLFEVLFPVFFVVAIGYYLGKKNSKLDTTFITYFGANIGSPAIIFYSVTTTGLTFDIFKSYFAYYFLPCALPFCSPRLQKPRNFLRSSLSL